MWGWGCGCLSTLLWVASTEKGWRASSSGRKTQCSIWLFECQRFPGHVCTWDKIQRVKGKGSGEQCRERHDVKQFGIAKLPGCCICPLSGALTAFYHQKPVCTVAALLLQARAMTDHHPQFLSYQLGLKHNPIPEGLCLLPVPDHSSATAIFFFLKEMVVSGGKKHSHHSLYSLHLCQNIPLLPK